jgi:hypothetical protein
MENSVKSPSTQTYSLTHFVIINDLFQKMFIIKISSNQQMKTHDYHHNSIVLMQILMHRRFDRYSCTCPTIWEHVFTKHYIIIHYHAALTEGKHNLIDCTWQWKSLALAFQFICIWKRSKKNNREHFFFVIIQPFVHCMVFLLKYEWSTYLVYCSTT